MPKLSLTRIRKYLRTVVWNPRKPSPMSIVSDAQNLDYYMTQAKILITETQEIPMTQIDINLKIKSAIRCLILAGVMQNES